MRAARALILPLALVAVLGFGGRAAWRYAVVSYGESDLYVLGVLLLQRFHLAPLEIDPRRDDGAVAAQHDDRPIVLDPRFSPFEEIGASLGPRAAGNQIFRTRGAVIADLNGDGKLDVFLPMAGGTVGTTTDANKVLTKTPLPAKPCVLFLNQGNDDAGRPIFKSVEELEESGNDDNVKAELLVENKLTPRRSLDDDEFAPGRLSTGAVAADFNGDGRLDLFITDELAGLPFTTEETALRAYPAARNIGRAEKHGAITIRLPQFLRRPVVDGTQVKLPSGEWEGRDTLLLNMGDTDGDGIPEWKDVTAQAGVGDRWASFSVAVADVDLDGDLDIFVANYQDPDFYGFGMRRFGGNKNALYLNRLAETGELRFDEVGAAWGVDGAGLPNGECFPSARTAGKDCGDEPIADQTVDGKPAGVAADHSWSAIFTDADDDGYPDLVVSTDEGDRLRVYHNDAGKRFVRDTRFDAPEWNGCWMGAAAGDLDGDGREEVFVTNCGGQSMSAANMGLIHGGSDESILALTAWNYAHGRARLAHALLSPSKENGTYRDITDSVTVAHSPVIAPDLVRRENFAPEALPLYDHFNYARGLRPYEFGFAAVLFDVENDGDLDLYFAGALARGNDGFIGDWTNSPGRMLINDTVAGGAIAFSDRTLEYRVLDIEDMDYAHNPPRRRSPGTNWHKRDWVYAGDMDSFGEAGIAAARRSLVHDLFSLHEAANGIASGDLNGDGYVDFIVTHFGGYNSLSPDARNLKADVGGVALAIPAPNRVMKPPTSFEEGATFVYINKSHGNHWLRVRLDMKGKNRRAIGAKIVAVGSDGRRQLRMVRAGGCAGSASDTDAYFGLGPDGAATAIEVTWPTTDRKPQIVPVDKLRDTLVCVSRNKGLTNCR